MPNEILEKLLQVDRETFAVVIDFLASMTGKKESRFKKAIAENTYTAIMDFLPAYQKDLETAEWDSVEDIYRYMRNR